MTTQHTATEGGEAAALPEGAASLPLFSRFTRIAPENLKDLPPTGPMQFAETVIDLAGGVKTVMELLEFNDRQELEGETRLFDTNEVFNLRRLVMASMELAEDKAQHLIDWAHRFHTHNATTGR